MLAVLTAIALPNFLGVTEDASARTAQQGVLNAYKECKVFWARNKRDGVGTNQREFAKPAITGWAILAAPSDTTYGGADRRADGSQPTSGTNGIACFQPGGGERDFFAVPIDSNGTEKFPIYRITSAGDRVCQTGSNSSDYPETFDLGCGDVSGRIGVWE